MGLILNKAEPDIVGVKLVESGEDGGGGGAVEDVEGHDVGLVHAAE